VPATKTSENQPDSPIEVYDFRRPTTIPREQARLLETCLDTFGKQFSTNLAARTRARVVVDQSSVALMTYSKWTELLDATTVMGLLSIAGADQFGVFQLDGRTAETWANYALGFRSPGTNPELPLSDVIQEILRDLIGVALEALQYSFSPALAIYPEFSSFNFAAHLAQAASPDDQMLIISFHVVVDGNDAPVTIALPASNITPALGAAGRTHTTDPAAAIADSTNDIPVKLRLEWNPMQTPTGDVVALSIGDTLRFPHSVHTKARVMLGDVEVATGELAVRTDTTNYVCKIETTHQENTND
jgi:flagellar motor switch protein FliM